LFRYRGKDDKDEPTVAELRAVVAGEAKRPHNHNTTNQPHARATMSFEESVTNWLQAFQAGDREAIRLLRQRYFHRMVGLARQKLGHSPGGAADEEDVALSAFDSFCQGVEQGQFARLENRDDLWRLLVVITVRKAVNLVQHEGRQKRRGDQVAETDDEVLHGLLSREPCPALAVAMNEECCRLLDLLGDEPLRKLVLLKLEGHTNTESAALLGRTRVTVQRMLKLIQQTWQLELAQ
jgi:DNA-directed RNA polymerase specialized sigma24 family protein